MTQGKKKSTFFNSNTDEGNTALSSDDLIAEYTFETPVATKAPSGKKFTVYKIYKNTLFLKNEKGTEERRLSAVENPGKQVGDTLYL